MEHWGIGNRKLGLIFSEGNTNFDTFLTDHECNKFCKFYCLPPLQPPPNDQGSPVIKSLQNTALPDPDDDSDLPDSILPQVTREKKNGEQGMSTTDASI